MLSLIFVNIFIFQELPSGPSTAYPGSVWFGPGSPGHPLQPKGRRWSGYPSLPKLSNFERTGNLWKDMQKPRCQSTKRVMWERFPHPFKTHSRLVLNDMWLQKQSCLWVFHDDVWGIASNAFWYSDDKIRKWIQPTHYIWCQLQGEGIRSTDLQKKWFLH